MKLYRWAIIFALILTAAANAQVSQTAVQFLLIAPGARAGGMGETFVAISDDATAVHWNPAGLGRYPLSGTWFNFNGNRQDTISAMVLVKNSLPEVNYKQYDIWGLVNNKLSSWDGQSWVTGVYRTLKGGSSLQTLIERYTGLSETESENYVDKIARANNTITPEAIDSLKTVITAVVPSDYDYKEEIDYGFEKLRTAWLRLRLDTEGFSKLRSEIESAAVETPISSATLDKIAFGFDKAISPKSGKAVWIPYSLILPDKINCIESDDELLYVGTDKGVFRLDPDKLRWSTITAEKDSLPSDRITAIRKFGARTTMLIGTDKGIVKYTGRKIQPFDAEAGAPKGEITAIAANNERDAWAASGNKLYHYDGGVWTDYKLEEISIGENPNKTIEKFYGDLGKVDPEKLSGEIAAFNSSAMDSARGSENIKLPYDLGYRGVIKHLGADSRGDLWIGTTMGIVYYSPGGFRQFGYKLYDVSSDGMGVGDVAAQYIADRDPNKIQKLSGMIKEYNGLESDVLQQGQKVMVYANALGSEILAIEPISADKALIATSYGVVEYDKGQWGRLQNLDISNKRVVELKERDNEIWVAAPEKVSVYSAAKKNLTFMHSNYLVLLADDLYYDYFSFVYPTKEWGTFGLGVTFLSYGKQERRSEGNVDLGTFYSYDLALTLSYGAKLSNSLSGGLSVRYINSHLAVIGAGKEKGKGTGYSLAVDAGVLYDLDSRLTLGATVTNLGPDIAYIDADQADPLPRKLAVGFNYKIFDSPFNRLSVLGEADKILVGLGDNIKTEIKEIIPHIGLEYWYSNYVALRGGYVYDKVGVQRYFTLGASLQYTNYRFDFSYIPSSDEAFNRLGNTMRFSMNAGF